MNNDKYDRKEIGRILKIASQLDQQGEQKEEGLSREELRKLAVEVGIDPNHIDTAIQKMREGAFEPVPKTFMEENFSYRDAAFIDGNITDEIWEDVVTEIRRINGGIGRTNKLGSTYEWEQRKKNVGYLQVSITPKNKRSRIRISANYQSYANVLGFIGGIVGFTSLSVVASSLALPQGAGLLVAGLGALAGWGTTRLYLKSWMHHKRERLQFITRRLTDLFQDQKKPAISEDHSGNQIEFDPSTEKAEEPDDTARRLRNR